MHDDNRKKTNFDDFETFMNADSFFSTEQNTGSFGDSYSDYHSNDYDTKSFDDAQCSASEADEINNWEQYSCMEENSNDSANIYSGTDSEVRPMTYDENKNYYENTSEYEVRSDIDRSSYGDARVSTTKDGIKRGGFVFLLGLLFVIVGIVVFNMAEDHVNRVNDFFENAEVVYGQIVDVQSYVSRSRKKRRTIYNIYVSYEYMGMNFQAWSEDITKRTAENAGVTDSSAIGQNVKIYIDKRNPSSMRLVREENGQPPYLVLALSVIGMIVCISGISLFVKCKNGKMLVVKRRNKTIYKTIK